MRRPKRAKKIAAWALGTLLGTLLAIYAGVNVAIGSGIHDISHVAMDRFEGDRIDALIALADCADCRVEDRNRAVWALGQFRDKRALPVLQKYYDGTPCSHACSICQRELEKAIRWTEGNAFMLPQIWRLAL